MTDVRVVAERIEAGSAFLRDVVREVEVVIVGQKPLLDGLLIGLLADGHVLLEGVPGLAKSLAVESLAVALGGVFRRIQFTPDLLPSDLLGTQVYNPQSGEWTVREGPVFANFVLADEINRAPAKVQSALLEVMAEGHASIAGESHSVPKPFFVLATLPEAQLDRFAMKILVDYPSQEDEEEIVRRMTSAPPIVRTLLSADEIVRLQELTDSVFVDHRVRAYAVRLVTATREPSKENLANLGPYLDLGASPRASLSLIRGAKALAVMRGRNYILPEDVHSLYLDCLRHRVILSYEALAADVRPDQVLNAILDAIPQPQVELGTGRSVA